MTTRVRLVLLVILVSAAGVGAALYAGGRNGGPRLSVARAERGPVVSTVSASGTLRAVVTVQVGSQVSGRIQDILADFNAPVRKGQLIARIDPASFEARVAQAHAQLAAARAAVLNQEAALERVRAEIATARATLAVGRAQLAHADIAVADTKRQLDRRTQLARKDLIAQSDLDAGQAAYDSARAQVDAARAQVEAQTQAVRAAEAQRGVGDAQLQGALAQVAERQAALRQAEVDLANTRIVAPVDGVVVSRNMDIGQTVIAALESPVLFAIAQNLSQMQVHASVDEADVGQTRVGQRATFTVDAFRGETFAGHVEQIRKAAQVTQGVVTYIVVVAAGNPSQKLLPGMTANVRIVVAERAHALKVPNTALRWEPARREMAGPRPVSVTPPVEAARLFRDVSPPEAREESVGQVWIRDGNGRLRAIAVRLGLTDGTFTEVVGGDLNAGQEIVTGFADSSGAAGARRR
jgi:HlyD family secretion protein